MTTKYNWQKRIEYVKIPEGTKYIIETNDDRKKRKMREINKRLSEMK